MVAFCLEICYYDPPSQEGEGEVVTTPVLHVFSSPQKAANCREGLEIMEGGIWFFDKHGNPLDPRFSEKPYINHDRNTYFPGVYSLESGKGETLQSSLSKYVAGSPGCRIIVRVPGNFEEFGWEGEKEMKRVIKQSMEIIPENLSERLVFE